MIDLERTKDMRDQERRDNNSQAREREPLGTFRNLNLKINVKIMCVVKIYRLLKLGAGLRSDAASDIPPEAGGKDVVRMDDDYM